MVTLGKEPNKALVKKLASLINCDFTHDKKKKKNSNNRKTNSMQKGPQCPRRFLQSSEKMLIGSRYSPPPHGRFTTVCLLRWILKYLQDPGLHLQTFFSSPVATPDSSV